MERNNKNVSWGVPLTMAMLLQGVALLYAGYDMGRAAEVVSKDPVGMAAVYEVLFRFEHGRCSNCAAAVPYNGKRECACGRARDD